MMYEDQLVREMEYLMHHFYCDCVNLFPVAHDKIYISLVWWNPAYTKLIGYYSLDVQLGQWFLVPSK